MKKWLNKAHQGLALDLIKKLPNESINSVVTSPPYWCYDEKTEVLCKSGWKKIKEVAKQDLVLSSNPENMQIEWVQVIATNKWHYEGEMVYFNNTHIDLLVTPDHKMFVYYKKNKQAIKPKNKNQLVTGKYDNRFYIDAKNIKNGYVTPKTGFIWIGEELDYFILPELKTIYNKQVKTFPELKIKTSDWVSFFGFWIAEGCVKGSMGGKVSSFTISMKQKNPKAIKVRSLLNKLPFDIKEYYDKVNDIYLFEINNKQLWNYLKQFGNSHTKFIPTYIKNLQKDKLDLLLEWYLLGDGTLNKKTNTWKAFSVSQKLIDDLLEISLKIGSNLNIQADGNMSFIKRKTVKLSGIKKETYYKGSIYGIEVEKHHNICVRRNNKVIFSGNCLRDYGYPDQWGLEPTYQEYLNRLWELMDEIKRVLKSNGTVWINLADTYVKKSLLLIPHQFAIGCNGNGWKVRNDIIWTIRNRKPECLHPDTKVIVKTIEGEVQKVSLQEIKDNFDNYVYINTPNGWKEILNVWEVKKESYREIEFGKIGKIICGEDHLFPITKEIRKKKIHDVKAKDLTITSRSNNRYGLWNNFNSIKLRQKNRLLLSEIVPRDIHNGFIWSNDNRVKSSIKVKNYEDHFINLDYDTGWIFGLYLAEGGFNTNNPKQLKITLHEKEKEFANKVIVFFNRRGLRPKLFKDKNYKAIYIQFSVGIFDYFINYFINGKCTNKSININNLFKTNISFIKGFIQGYLDGDGHFIEKTGNYTVSSASPYLMEDIQTLLLFTQKKQVSLYEATQIDKRSNKINYSYSSKVINYNQANRNTLGYQLRVKSNEIINKPITLIDIEVDEGYFMLANGIVTHNSVKDRFSRKHEYVFLLVKNDKYFFDLDSIKDPLSDGSIQRALRGMSNKNKYTDFEDNQTLSKARKRVTDPNERIKRIAELKAKGKNPGNIDILWSDDIWDIPNKGTKLNHYACVDEQTECLTINGWKSHNEILKDDLLASYDHLIGKIQYKPIKNLNIYNVEKEVLLEIDSSTLSMVVTKNHRQLSINKKGKVYYREFKDLTQQDRFFTFANWSDFSIEDNSSIELWELMGWISSDGHYTSRSIHITQSYTVNEEKCKRIEYLLKKLKFDYKIKQILRTDKKTKKEYLYYDFFFKLKDSYQIFNYMPNKIPQWYFPLVSKDKIKAFIDGFIGGDGHIRNDKRITIGQKNKETMDVIQIMVNKLGYRSILSKVKNLDMYQMSLTRHQFVTARKTNGKGLKIKEIVYSGIIWCPETEDGNFVMRRNGRIVITGNSYPPHLIKKIVLAGCPKGGIILDPFCGSSSTGVAAIDLDRTYIGFDGSKEYVEMSNKRLKKVLGNKTKKLF